MSEVSGEIRLGGRYIGSMFRRLGVGLTTGHWPRITLIGWVCFVPSIDQATAQKRPVSLAAPMHWKTTSIPIFENDPRNLRIDLTTSWILGTDRKGFMRYKIAAYLPPPALDEPSEWKELDTPEQTKRFLLRVKACSLSLLLNDADNFRLSAVPLVLHEGIDDTGRIAELDENSGTELNERMYRSFLHGRFEISWDCNV